ncbi:MAG TPA: PAS domain S-box protein [Mucilaginibacter sp.]|jgi:PAS domain S-box-containing protein
MFWKSFKIPFGFLITGVLWALFSHPLIAAFTKGFSQPVHNIARGVNHFAFVGFVSVILYFLIKKQHKELILSEDQYRNLFERNPNPMWIYCLSTLNFAKVNHAAVDLYGYSNDEFMAMSIMNIRPDGEQTKLLDVISNLDPGVSKQGNWVHKKKSGELLYVSIVTYDLNFNNEACRLVMATNVTETIIKEERIKAQNAALHEIAWLNSHEVRKSLCSVMSLTALLKDTPSEHERREYINMIEQCTNELDGMLKKTNNRVDELKEHDQAAV